MSDQDMAHWRLSIGAVERDTGLSKDTLRVWEKRYGFPQPERDRFGERVYPREQVEKLRLLKRLIDRGHRPGKLVARSVSELLQVGANAPSEAMQAGGNGPRAELFNTQDIGELQMKLRQSLQRQGLRAFVLETVSPLHQQLSDAWTRGQLALHEEKLYTGTIETVLHGALGTLPAQNNSPRVLMGTFPNEPRTLGLTMMECLLAQEGCLCIPLGAHTPVVDLVLAARAQHADIVAVYFSAAYPVTQALEGLSALREQLPEGTQIWAGSNNPAVTRRASASVLVLPRFDMLGEAVSSWRQTHMKAMSAPH